MMFATPDFGAGASIGAFLGCVWLVVIAFAILGLTFGVKLCKSDKSKSKKYGIVLVLVSGIVPLSCCLLPSQIVRLTSGNYPLGRYPNKEIEKGMTRAEVASILGVPHEKQDSGVGEGAWYYWIDSFGIRYFRVHFGEDGRVMNTSGN